MYKQIKEGKAFFFVPQQTKISKKLPVFYNPDMELNRTISIALLNSIDGKNLQILLPLSGTGIRGIRFTQELEKGKIRNITLNDMSLEAIDIIKKNMDLNNVSDIVIKNKDANILLLESTGYDYIDIDPFGSPNFLLNNAIVRLSRNGILAVTATDTSALSGTYPKACIRKYFAKPLRNELMHEIGIRILIQKTQKIAAQFDKALTPLYSYSTLHYMRVFFRCEKGKEKTDELLCQHAYLLHCPNCLDRKTSSTIFNTKCVCGSQYDYAGPIWTGKLWDEKTAEKISKKINIPLTRDILEESKINIVGFYDIHKLVKKYKIKAIPKKEQLIKNIIGKGYLASNTHFSPEAIRSNIEIKELIRIIQ